MIPANELIFMEGFDAMAEDVHKNSVTHGFWEDNPSDADRIALMHSELSEGLEAARHGNPPSDHIPSFSGLEEELADCIIRIMDFATRRGLRLSQAIVAKHEFNRNRPYKHGKQF